ncbi:unnamed protein product [Caenorhabditis auriculariae]|uniref:Beta-1,4-mannosyltransferase bre-3 n=1 Tax=Caenorhabditis auriculariae TaxID=2777116 RepID=A0A8S1HQG6_9PELO|nr:unnamed protein product [Caenorhabditis auriculariae]
MTSLKPRRDRSVAKNSQPRSCNEETRRDRYAHNRRPKSHPGNIGYFSFFEKNQVNREATAPLQGKLKEDDVIPTATLPLRLTQSSVELLDATSNRRLQPVVGTTHLFNTRFQMVRWILTERRHRRFLLAPFHFLNNVLRSLVVMNCEVKHALHCTVLLSWIVGFAYFCGVFTEPDAGTVPDSPVESYGYIWTTFLYLLRLTALLVLPQCLCNLFGLVLFNAFREKVHLKAAPLLSPFVCFRVVTKGDFPQLVKENVVTDKPINLPQHPRVREVVVPKSYRTKSGAKFKARALQYCLEDDNADWIVHLDEETLLTTNAICGILNFCEDGKHQFGQGVITYANGEIVNWLTTLSDSFRVADDMGKLRLQFKMFHKPLFGWKGSFVVTQVEAERKVSYDHGMEGSIAEDCFFSMVAMKHGYTFDFIEGEMHEKSPFTMWDFLQQRKRWLQGILLTVHSPQIALAHKALLGLSLYAWATMPITSLQVFLCPLFPLPRCLPFDFALSFVGAVNLYMYIFGVIKSFSHKYRNNSWRLILYLTGALMTIPFNILIENLAVIVGMFGRKDQFYIPIFLVFPPSPVRIETPTSIILILITESNPSHLHHFDISAASAKKYAPCL